MNVPLLNMLGRDNSEENQKLSFTYEMNLE